MSLGEELLHVEFRAGPGCIGKCDLQLRLNEATSTEHELQDVEVSTLMT
jgi:hypothetical protein